MNLQEYEQLQSEEVVPCILGLADLQDHTPRTLIFGYDTDRNTFHVYIGPDGLIHVLHYVDISRSSDNATPFLILSHSAGPSGGLTNNDHYVPSKRVYPESCDMAFCRVLKRYRVNIPFTKFNTEEAHATRLAARRGYAGFTLEQGGCPVVDLRDTLIESRKFLSGTDPHTLSTRLITEASRILGVHIVTSSYSDYVGVASTGADAVLEKAKALFDTLPDLMEDTKLSINLLNKIFDGGGAYHEIREESTYGGELYLQVSAAGTTFHPDKSFLHFKPESADSYWKNAVVGTYQGRPFIACISTQGYADIRLSQFGDTERFTAQGLRLYGLELVATGSSRKLVAM
jgi:hypothetical protein